MTPARLLALFIVSVTAAVVLGTVAVSPDRGLWKLVLVAVALGGPGALGAARHPRNPVGWLLVAVGLIFACMGLASQLLEAGRGGPWASWVAGRAGAVVVPLTFLALLLLPDGRLPSRRWRPVVAVVLAAQVAMITTWSLVAGPSSGGPNPIGVIPTSWASRVDTVGDWVLQLPFLLVMAALVVRLRRREDRAQLAAVLWAAAGFAVLAIAGRLVWPAGADAVDVLGAGLLGAGLTVTLLRAPGPPPRAAPAGGRHDKERADQPPVPDVAGLSEREREVLTLVADGLTNRQIADQLFISPVTARNHVSRILTKLGLENRTQAATWLARRTTERTSHPT